PIEEVYYLKAEQKYVTAHWPDGELLLDESLKSLENEFPELFIRIHRNALVSTARIRGLEKDAEGNSFLLMRDMEDRLPVSRRHLATLKKMLKE
ncbi:MAG: LytTR family DNA-binding domain-containing protein, partial [Gammaproteobacteria bacterium]|nr:LytTR family DNA-binding domain-containing protein [Gammaproteobacteria bacterium]